MAKHNGRRSETGNVRRRWLDSLGGGKGHEWRRRLRTESQKKRSIVIGRKRGIESRKKRGKKAMEERDRK